MNFVVQFSKFRPMKRDVSLKAQINERVANESMRLMRVGCVRHHLLLPPNVLRRPQADGKPPCITILCRRKISIIVSVLAVLQLRAGQPSAQGAGNAGCRRFLRLACPSYYCPQTAHHFVYMDRPETTPVTSTCAYPLMAHHKLDF
ncbi:RNA-dependent RNA polymerase, putative [Babesia ovata]|uniref:RNA-dependent RNA polymerase, putative n=1 Tax=Babesia ovata TaxID=189622 RepID=A0A2H6KC68_9APIC|nr:RNA-dependent RNA polymerase, putative [Babesia ovata]GBE60585.1 RNA-dependent RNA polymerase, putative [Babesia ovata]